MLLTDKEKRMLAGEYGLGIKSALEVVIKMGELYGAKRLLTVKNAHIDAASYTTIWDAGTEFIEYLVDNGARVSIPTTINPCARDIEDWRQMGLTPEFSDKSQRLEAAYLQMGVIPTWSCAPYQATSVPSFGEILSWSESNAVNYANSVLGARANRLPDLVDVCCAVTARVPEYGLYITENRAGQILFKLEDFSDTWFNDVVDYAMLGYLVGEIAVNRVPVILGLPAETTKDQLKALSAAAASGGAIALFHAVGLTPEANTLAAAFQNRTDYETCTVRPDDIIKTKEKLTTAKKGKVDMVLTGCPFLSYTEISEINAILGDRKIAAGTKFWIQTSRIMYDLAKRTGLAAELESKGITFIKDTCLNVCDVDKDWGFETIATNSGKIAQYVTGLAGAHVAVMSTAECIDAAVKGAW